MCGCVLNADWEITATGKPLVLVRSTARHSAEAGGAEGVVWVAESGLVSSRSAMPRQVAKLGWNLLMRPSTVVMKNGASFETYVCFNRKKVTFMETDVYDHMLIRGVRDTSLSRRGRIANFMEKYSGK